MLIKYCGLFLFLLLFFVYSGCEKELVKPLPPEVSIDSVVVNPESATIETEKTILFDAEVHGTGDFNPSVTWSAKFGTVNNGRYTAPNFEATDTVKAVSVQDTAKFGTATVTVEYDTSYVTSVEVFPDSQTVRGGEITSFGVKVEGVGNFNPEVDWSVKHGNIEIQNKGITYIAPDFASKDTVRAVSVTDSTKSDLSVVNVLPPIRPMLVYTITHSIYVMCSDGSKEKLSKSDVSQDDFPDWSPDGEKIVFYSNRTGLFNLFTMNSDGSGQENITPSEMKNVIWPSWSPDGKKIVFTGQHKEKETWDIYSLEIETGRVLQLTQEEKPSGVLPSLATYSPDGTKIAFHTSRDGNGEIYIMDSNGDNKKNITNHPASETSPSWSPDGRKIAFSSKRNGNGRRNIYVMDISGSGEVVKITPDNGLDKNSPDWSPEGNKLSFIMFDAQNTPSPPEIYTINTDGTEMKNISNTPNLFEDSPKWHPLYNMK